MAVVHASCPLALSDDCLLRRFAQGDREALDELFRRYRLPAYRVAYRLLGLERADLRTLLDAALQTLSCVQRQTFVLHADAGLSYREVAEAMEVSIGTVMSRLYYARLKLRAFLKASTDL